MLLADSSRCRTFTLATLPLVLASPCHCAKECLHHSCLSGAFPSLSFPFLGSLARAWHKQSGAFFARLCVWHAPEILASVADVSGPWLIDLLLTVPQRNHIRLCGLGEAAVGALAFRSASWRSS